MTTYDLKLFSGNANRPLAEEIAQYLHLPLGDADVSRFSDLERKRNLGLAYLQAATETHRPDHAAAYYQKSRELLEAVQRENLPDGAVALPGGRVEVGLLRVRIEPRQLHQVVDEDAEPADVGDEHLARATGVR